MQAGRQAYTYVHRPETLNLTKNRPRRLGSRLKYSSHSNEVFKNCIHIQYRTVIHFPYHFCLKLSTSLHLNSVIITCTMFGFSKLLIYPNVKRPLYFRLHIGASSSGFSKFKSLSKQKSAPCPYALMGKTFEK